MKANGAAGAVVAASAAQEARTLTRTVTGSLRSKTPDDTGTGLRPRSKRGKPKPGLPTPPKAVSPMPVTRAVGSIEMETPFIPRSLSLLCWRAKHMASPASVLRRAKEVSCTTESIWRWRPMSASPGGVTFRVGAGLLRRWSGPDGVGIRKGPLNLFSLASPILPVQGDRRLERGECVATRALLDKSHGPPSPGGASDGGKQQKVGTTAIPATSGAAEPAAVQTSGSTSSSSARMVLERLFAQAQLYEQRAGNPEFAAEEELEAVVRQLELDLGQVLKMLRSKEGDLGKAEARLQREREEVETARSVLVQRESQLEAARAEQLGRQGELQVLQKALRDQRKETERVTLQLRKTERELGHQREEVKKKSRELQVANVQLVEQKTVLTDLESLLAGKQRDLAEALEEREQQRLELASLQSVLARQREDHRALSMQLDSKRQRLESVELDLSLRTQAFVAARSEIQSLQVQLQGMAGANRASERELHHAQELLAEVHDELRASNSAVAEFQVEVKEQEANALRLEAEISRLTKMLQSKERELGAASSSQQHEVQELQKVQREVVAAQKRVQELERESESRAIQLQEEKERSSALTEELSSLKKEMRQQSAALSDAQLSLQVKEAELLTTRLELQQLRSDFSASQLSLKQKTEDLEGSQRTVASLRAELAVVRRQLAEKESQLAGLGAALAEKDKAISLLQMDASSSRLKLSEAEHALEQIAQLSRTLADTAKQGSEGEAGGERALSVAFSRAGLLSMPPETPEQLQHALLTQANEDLFFANTALLELDMKHHRLQDKVDEQAVTRRDLQAELEATQECLRETEAELEVTREVLMTKDEQLKALVQQWEAREEHLGRMREEVLEGAKEIEALRDMARASGLVRVQIKGGSDEADDGSPALDGVPDEAAITRLEFEVAKLEADSAIAALKALAELSTELKEGCSDVVDTSPRSEPVVAAAEEVASGPTVTTTETGPEKKVHKDVTVGIRPKVPNPTASAVAKMEEQLREKDAALSMAKQAMENLAELTRRLVMEASAMTGMAGGIHPC